VRGALEGHESVSLLPQSSGVLQLVTVPIAIGLTRPEILGTLSLGFLIDDAVAAQLKAMTGSDVAFGMDGHVLAATLPLENRGGLAALLLPSSGLHQARIGSVDYVVLQQRLSAGRDGDSPSGPGRADPAVTDQELAEPAGDSDRTRRHGRLRRDSRTLQLRRCATITRPLAAITGAMRDVAATGDRRADRPHPRRGMTKTRVCWRRRSTR
jgi:hypothetical protein